MKYVYVLTSTPNDLYYEQCLMSATSLRLYMPDACIIVLTDNKTAASFTTDMHRTKLSEISEIITIPFSDTASNIERSRIIKTNIPAYIDDDFLFIDCDTIICADLSEIESTEKYPMILGGVLDGHETLEKHIHKKYFLQRDKKLGFKGEAATGININSGVVLFRKCPETIAFYNEWKKLWEYSFYKKKDHHDQAAFNEASYRKKSLAKLLSGEWNCQPSHGGLAFLKDAKIIHYYSSEFSGKNYVPYYKLADKSLQLRIKESGFIPDDIMQMIREPKFQFNKVHIINDSRIVSIMQSPLTFTLADIKSKLPALFNLMENIMAFFRSLGKKIRRGKAR